MEHADLVRYLASVLERMQLCNWARHRRMTYRFGGLSGCPLRAEAYNTFENVGAALVTARY